MMTERRRVDRDNRRGVCVCANCMHGMGWWQGEEMGLCLGVSTQNHRNKVLSSRDFSSLTYIVLRIIADGQQEHSSLPPRSQAPTPAAPAMDLQTHTINAPSSLNLLLLLLPPAPHCALHHPLHHRYGDEAGGLLG